MPNDNSRNTVIFIVCAGILLVAYQFLVMGPAQRKAEAEAKQKAAAAARAQPGIGAPGMPGDPAAPVYISRPQALAATPRIKIETPALTGSISLKGARFDDLFLKGYRQTLDKASPPVEMFRPEGVRYAYFAQTGWAGQNIPGLPNQDTVWSVKQGGVLTPTQPVVLTYDNGQGLVFDRAISVDDRFMFTVKDTVTNRAGLPITLAPYASVQRQGLANPKGASGVHEGAISVLGLNDQFRLKLRKYAPWKKDGEYALTSTGGWLGVTDKYWLAAFIPDQREGIRGQFRVSPVGGVDVYDANFVGAARNLAPGFQASATTRLFAGAKTVPVLRNYSDALSIPRFVDAVDWGWGYFITKPIFYTIELFYGWIGNFGLAILMMTVVVKLAFFYPANLSFESMTKMKKVQPQLEKLKAAHKDDPSGMQQAMMRLYKEEKINPMLGCLPMLATIPVFIGLFHVLNVSIEMRHAPFFGWIQDLSSRDPTTILNLFGLIPWDPSTTPLIGGILDGPLHLGAWPLLYGFTMWLTQSMSPPAADPMQQKILMWMPIIFTFVMTQLAAGLMIYYTWSNVLTILQQYVIMRRFKVDTPIDQVIRKVTGKPSPAAG